MAFKGFFNAAFVKDTLKTTAFSSVGRAIGFLIPFFIAAWFGTSPQTDAFFFIYGLVIFLSSIFASTVAAVIVPYIAEMLARRENPGRFISSLLQISTLLLTLLLGAAAVLLAGFFVFFNPFSPAVTAESILMLCELLPLVFLLVWTGILEGVLQADKKFSLPALSLILRAALTITLIWLFKPWLGIHAVITGYLAGEAARFLLLLIAAGRLRLFRFHCLRRPDGRVKDFLGKAAFQVVGVTAMGLNPVIDKLMAATLPMGSVSVLYYAERLFLIPVTFLVSGVLITLLSYWSGGLQTAGRTQLARDVSRTARWTVSPGLLVTVAVLLLAGPLAELAYGRGEMTAGTIHLIAEVTVVYFLGFLPLVIGQVYVRALIVIRRTRTLMMAALMLCLANVCGNLALIPLLGVRGIALATSLVNVAGSVIMWRAFRNHTHGASS